MWNNGSIPVVKYAPDQGNESVPELDLVTLVIEVPVEVWHGRQRQILYQYARIGYVLGSDELTVVPGFGLSDEDVLRGVPVVPWHLYATNHKIAPEMKQLVLEALRSLPPIPRIYRRSHA